MTRIRGCCVSDVWSLGWDGRLPNPISTTHMSTNYIRGNSSVPDFKTPYSETELMCIQHGIMALVALREHMKVGVPIEQLDIDLFDHGISKIKNTLKVKL